MAKKSVVRLSQLHGAFRLDAECYEPEVLRDQSALAHLSTIKLGSIAYITDGQHGYHEVDEASEIRHITARCVSGGIVTDAQADRLAKSTHDANPSSQLQQGDVILSTAGTIGNAGFVCADTLPANIDQDVARVALNEHAPVDSHFLVAFLNSEYGQFQCRRATTGQIQGHISLAALHEFDVPILPNQSRVADLMRKCVERWLLAKQAFGKAESTLTWALGLDQVDLSPSLYYERPFVDLLAARRFNAEYFMPCKKRALDALVRMPGRPLGDHYRSARELFQPGDANPREMVRNFDLTEALDPVLDDTREPIAVDQLGSTKKQLATGDIVVSRLRSYLKEIALVKTTTSLRAVGSSEFIVLRRKSKAISAATLLIYLRSLPVQTILHWSQDGSNHPRFNEADLLALPVPEQVERAAPKVDGLVDEAINARHEARRLFEQAKAQVERLVVAAARR